MSDLEFGVTTQWSGDAALGQGRIATGNQQVHYSAPGSMGGVGVGTNPEELLLSAVAACYTIGLARLLHKSGLPVASLQVQAKGIVWGYPFATKFARIIVSPDIHGADQTRFSEYESAAHGARERCFIGKTLSGEVSYELGAVTLPPKNLASGQQ